MAVHEVRRLGMPWLCRAPTLASRGGERDTSSSAVLCHELVGHLPWRTGCRGLQEGLRRPLNRHPRPSLPGQGSQGLMELLTAARFILVIDTS